MYRFLLSLCFISVLCSTSIHAERGELYSYEELAYFDHDAVVEFYMNQFGSYLDPEEFPVFFQVARAFFEGLIDERDITVYKLIYETIDFDGNPVQASGIILIPGHDNYDCTNQMSLYAHGTIFNREAVNSRPSNWGGEFMLTMMMASINTICVAPDYYGLGDGDGFHHHNTYRTNVNSSLDAVRAGRNLCDQLGIPYNDQLTPMGYSEGGHASMGIGRMIREEGLTEEFKIRFVGAGSGAYDMSGEAFEFITSDPYYATPQYILYQAASCQDMYGNLIDEEAGQDFSYYLVPPYDQLFEDNILAQNGNTYWIPDYWPDLFQPGRIDELTSDPQHPFRVCLAQSNVYNWLNTYPTVMYYCTTDEQVPYTGALKTRDVQRSLLPWYLFWQRFKIQAIDLTFNGFIPDHGTCALPSIFLQTFFMQRTLGNECLETGRQTASLRSVRGEELNGMVVSGPKVISFDQPQYRGSLKSITVIEMATGEAERLDVGQTYEIEANGLYLFSIEQADGSIETAWMYKSDVDFVPTHDYNPLLVRPMVDHTVLDLSLLDEPVHTVALLDEEGREIAIYKENLDQDQVRLDRPSSLPDGTYRVEVRTRLGNYALPLEASRQISSSTIEAYPNPVRDKMTFRLPDCDEADQLVKIYAGNGQLIRESQENAAACRLTLDLVNLSPGNYHAELIGSATGIRRVLSFSKQ